MLLQYHRDYHYSFTRFAEYVVTVSPDTFIQQFFLHITGEGYSLSFAKIKQVITDLLG